MCSSDLCRGDNSVGGRLPGDMHTSGSVEERRPDRVRYTDRQQVFVGNLPPTISESELKAVFKGKSSCHRFAVGVEVLLLVSKFCCWCRRRSYKFDCLCDSLRQCY